MTSDSDGFGKRGTTGTVAGSVVPEFPGGSSGIPERHSPTEVSLRSQNGDRAVLRPGQINPENIFLPAHDPAKKNPVRSEFSGPGNFLPVTSGADKILRFVRFYREKSGAILVWGWLARSRIGRMRWGGDGGSEFGGPDTGSVPAPSSIDGTAGTRRVCFNPPM